MNKETMELYAQLEAQKREIKEQQSKIKEDALVFLKESGADKIESDFGAFKVVARKSWTYSDTVKELESKVKSTKKAEEESGAATAEVEESLTFYPVK